MALGENLKARKRLTLPGEERPALMVVIDTEEEFDWDAGFDRNSTAVSAMREVERFQNVFDEFGHRPTYVIDYPVATDSYSIERLGKFRKEGRAQVGAHLHPWVTAPHDEDVNARNSYQGNLPPELELAKLTHLTETITTNFGFSPTIHKAGRYGFGPKTAEHLLMLGYEIDLSVAAAFDLSGDAGPDYSQMDAHLYRYGADDALFGIPTTGGFVGPLRFLGPSVFSHRALSTKIGWLRAGLLSKPKLLERVLLSPEGQTLEELKRLTKGLINAGVRVLTFSMHSPSAKPGCTPYTNTDEDVEAFTRLCRDYFQFFRDEIGGIGTVPHEAMKRAKDVGFPLPSR